MTWLLISIAASLLWHLAVLIRYIPDREGQFTLARRRVDVAHEFPDGPPLLSVLIPAFNEERNIGRCLESLVRQDYPNVEIIAADDNSTDATPAIIERFGAEHPQVRRILAGQRPDGWTARNWPLQQAFEASSGEYLLLLDADNELVPECLSVAMARAESQQVDLLSITALSENTGRWYDVLVGPGYSITPPVERLASDPNHPLARARGPFMLFKRRSYEQIGENRAVYWTPNDDVLLSQKIKRSGLKLEFLIGQDLLTTRFYDDFEEFYPALQRWVFAGVRELSRAAAAALIPGLIALGALLLLPWATLPAALGVLLFTGWCPTWFGVALASAATLGVSFATRRMIQLLRGVPVRGFQWQPVGLALILAVSVVATFKLLLGRAIHFKGRDT